MPGDTDKPLPTKTTEEVTELSVHRDLVKEQLRHLAVEAALNDAFLAQAVEMAQQIAHRKAVLEQLLCQIDQEIGMSIAEDDVAW